MAKKQPKEKKLSSVSIDFRKRYVVVSVDYEYNNYDGNDDDDEDYEYLVKKEDLPVLLDQLINNKQVTF